MMNNKGAMRFEFITMVALFIILLCGGLMIILNGASKQKFNTMIDSALNFSHTVAGNTSAFAKVDLVFLNEVINENLIDEIKNPFGAGYCDKYQSYVSIKNGSPYVTLICGDYLIDNTKITDKEKVDFYKISKWSKNKPSGDFEKKELYNCKGSNGKEMFDSYLDEAGLIARLNVENGTSYYSINEVSDSCDLMKNVFYRKKNLFNK